MIKVLFFGSIANKVKKRDCCLPARENMTVADVVDAVGCACFQPLLVAVNQEQVKSRCLVLFRTFGASIMLSSIKDTMKYQVEHKYR